MNLLLRRRWFEPTCTIGTLAIDGVWECYTLEDVERDTKLYGVTAIPRGRYEVVIDMSRRFKRLLPRLVDVPGFEGVRIHPGNTASDTDGCILVGMDKYIDGVGHSRIAFASLMGKLLKATDPISIEITR